jgi:hypothetical protein
MEIPFYSIEFFIPKTAINVNANICNFEKVFERTIPSNVGESNLDWYLEYGIRKLAENRKLAIEYYNAFLNYRSGNRSFFGDWDEKKLLPIIEKYQKTIKEVWAAVFLNIKDSNYELKKKIEITGVFDRGKWQFFKLK